MPFPAVRACSATILLFALGCSSEPDIDPSVAAVRQSAQECREKLSEAEYSAARATARNRLEDADTARVPAQEVNPLRLCFVMAHSLRELDQSSTTWKTLAETLAGLLEGTLEEGQSPGQIEATFQASATVGQQHSTLLNELLGAVVTPWETLLDENLKHLEIILATDDFDWTTDRLPVHLAGQELVDVGGRYGMSEIHMLYGMTRALRSTLHVLLSQDYSFNLSAIAAYAQLETEESPLKQYRDHPLAAVLNVYATVMGTSTRFLTLREDGAQRMAAAGQGYAAGLDALLAGIDALTERTGDSGYLLEFKQENEEDYILVHADFSRDMAEGFQGELGKFGDVTIPLRENVLESLERVRASTAGVGVRAHLQKDIFPIVSLLSVVALRSGLLDAVLSDMLGLLEPDVADDLSSTLEFGRQSQDHFLMLMLSAVPMDVELDLGIHYAHPIDLRDIAPGWFQPAPDENNRFYMEDFTTATMVYSYECDEDPLFSDVPTRFLCPKDAALSDRGHFEDLGTEPWIEVVDNFGATWEGRIDNDGIQSRFPYIGFKDPTMGGILYVADKSDASQDPVPATQEALNAALAETVATILDVYGL